MPSLQDLIASKQPSELEALLASLQGKEPTPEANSSVMPSATPTSEPTPGPQTASPQDVPPTPLSPQMLGLKMDTGPNSSQMPDTDRTPASTPDSDDSDKDSDTDDSDDDTTPSDGPLKVSDDHFTGDASDDQKKNLQDLFNNVHSLNTLRNAQGAENTISLNNSLAQAGNTIGSGLAGAIGHGAPPKDVSADFYKEQQKQASVPVDQLLQQQDQDFKDPNSQASVGSRQLAGAVLAKAGFDPKMVDGMSHDDIVKQFPQLTSLLNHKDATDANILKAQQNHLDRQALIASRQDAGANKASQAQDKALQNTKALLESARGNPAAAQAEKDLYASAKAKSLTNLYGDPNKLSNSQVQLLASEIGKIASGGVPTSHELEGLTPQTLASKFSGVASQLINKPTPANAAAFVKQYQDYADALTKDAKQVISDKYGRVIESSKKQLGDDNYNTLKDQYLNRFTKDSSGSSTPSTTYPKTVINPTTKQQATVSSSAEEQEANQHGFQ